MTHEPDPRPLSERRHELWVGMTQAERDAYELGYADASLAAIILRRANETPVQRFLGSLGRRRASSRRVADSSPDA
jgi:hypothetical protein